MKKCWIEEDEGLKLICELVGKKVTRVNVDKRRRGIEITIEFENKTIINLEMFGYPEEWDLSVITKD